MQTEKTKNDLEIQFEELFFKAKSLYPDIEDSICTLNNITAKTTDLQDYLNLTTQTPNEISTNQITVY